MLLTAEQHRRLAEIFEEAAADQSHSPEDRALLAQKAARFRWFALVAVQKAKARRLN
jgi:pyruvate-formate lyase